MANHHALFYSDDITIDIPSTYWASLSSIYYSPSPPISVRLVESISIHVVVAGDKTGIGLILQQQHQHNNISIRYYYQAEESFHLFKSYRIIGRSLTRPHTMQPKLGPAARTSRDTLIISHPHRPYPRICLYLLLLGRVGGLVGRIISSPLKASMANHHHALFHSDDTTIINSF